MKRQKFVFTFFANRQKYSNFCGLYKVSIFLELQDINTF